MPFPIMSNIPLSLNLLNVMDFIITVAAIEATLRYLQKLICLLLSEVPKGKDASVMHVLHTYDRLIIFCIENFKTALMP